MPAMLILLTSMSTLALLSKAMIAIPSLSLMLSSKTTSSGKRTLRLPGFCRAKTLALRDMALAYVALWWADCAGSSNVFPLGCHSGCMIILLPSSQFVFQGLRRRSAVPRATFAALVGGLGLVLSARWGLWRGLRAEQALQGGAAWTWCPWCTGAVSHLSMAAGHRPAVHPSAPQDMAGAAQTALSTRHCPNPACTLSFSPSASYTRTPPGRQLQELERVEKRAKGSRLHSALGGVATALMVESWSTPPCVLPCSPNWNPGILQIPSSANPCTLTRFFLLHPMLTKPCTSDSKTFELQKNKTNYC